MVNAVLTTIRVLLVHSQPLVRAGIRALLERIKGVEVVGESDVDGTLQMLRRHLPHVILLNLPEGDGFEMLQEVVTQFPTVIAIVLAANVTKEFADQVLLNGAAGYLPNSADSSELELAINAVMRGETYLWPKLSELDASAKHQRASIAELTPRQQEVLRMVAEGLSTREIARELNISVKTVETHRAQLMDRLNIHDVPGLVRYALKVGLIELVTKARVKQ